MLGYLSLSCYGGGGSSSARSECRKLGEKPLTEADTVHVDEKTAHCGDRDELIEALKKMERVARHAEDEGNRVLQETVFPHLLMDSTFIGGSRLIHSLVSRSKGLTVDPKSCPFPMGNRFD